VSPMRTALAVLALSACAQPPAPVIDVPQAIRREKPPVVPAAPVEAFEVRAVEAKAAQSALPPPLAVTPKVEYHRADRLSPKSLRSVTVGFDLIGANPGVLAVEFVAPDGQVYERRELGLEGSAFRTQHVELELAVGGTWIDTQEINGHWTAHAYLRGEEVAVAGFEVAQ